MHGLLPQIISPFKSEQLNTSGGTIWQKRRKELRKNLKKSMEHFLAEGMVESALFHIFISK